MSFTAMILSAKSVIIKRLRDRLTTYLPRTYLLAWRDHPRLFRPWPCQIPSPAETPVLIELYLPLRSSRLSRHRLSHSGLLTPFLLPGSSVKCMDRRPTSCVYLWRFLLITYACELCTQYHQCPLSTDTVNKRPY